MAEHTITPSWRQLATIHDSATKAAILRALSIDPPPESFSLTFEDRGIQVQATANGFVLYEPGGPSRYANGSDVIRASRSAPGTPVGDALRTWLRRWGWVPKSERPAHEPTADTRTII